MDCDDLNPFEDDDIIEPCRACGIYFIMNQAIIQPIFSNLGAGDNLNTMPEIVQQMNEWNLQVKQEDGRPQYMCKACIHEFQKVLKFKRSCVETQEQFDALDYTRAHNGVVIKKEIETEQTFCGFVYLDTDDEEGSEDGSRRVCAPLDIPHVPIKMEHAARVPQEMPLQPTIPVANDLPEEATFSKIVPQRLATANGLGCAARIPQDTPFRPATPVVSDLPEEATFSQVEPQKLAAANGLSSTIFDADVDENQEESDEEIIKFTYDDDNDGEEIDVLPAPLKDPDILCKLCGHVSLTQELHTQHMERIHLLKDCECHICGKKFVNARESRIRFHMKWHKLQKHLKCPICGFFCNSKATLKEHKLAVHTRTKCYFCGKLMKHHQLQEHLNRHIEAHEEELARKLKANESLETPVPTEKESSLIGCAFCEWTSNDPEQLQAHVMDTHTTQPADQPDLEVSAKLPSSALQFELDTSATPASQFEMDTSATPSQDISNTSLHSETAARPEISMYECHLCGNSFNLKIKLNRHLIRHSEGALSI